MKYTITITKKTKEIKKTRDWVKIRDIPESMKSKSFYEKNEVEEYGYVDNEVEKDVDTEIYCQTIETDKIDMMAIVKAFNGEK